VAAQLLFISLLFLVGIAVQASAAVNMARGLAAVVALPLGLLVWTSAVVAALVLRVPIRPVTMLLAMAGVIAAGLAIGGSEGRRAIARAVGEFVLVLGVYGAVACAVGIWDFSVMSPDGIMMTNLGKIIAQTGGLHWSLAGTLPDWGIFTVAVQAPASWLRLDYLNLVHPMLAASVAAQVFWLVQRHSGDVPVTAATRLFAAFAALFVGTCLFFVFNAFFVHNSMPTAMFVTTAFTLLAESAADGGVRVRHLGWFGIFGIVLSRPEGPILAAIVAVAFMASDGPQSKVPAMILAGATCAWYAQVALLCNASSDVMSAPKAVITASALVAVALVDALPRRLSLFMKRHAAPLMVGGLVCANVVAMALSAPDYLLSAKWVLLNLLYTGRWGTSWAVAFSMLPLAMIAGRRGRIDRALGFILLTFPLFVLLIGSMRNPYRHGWGDSANRMFLHVFPLLVAYLCVRLGPLAAGASSSEELAATTTRP